MGICHRLEDFPQRTVSVYLAGRPNSGGIKIRILSTERIILTEIKVQGGGTIPRHYHEAEQIVMVRKGETRVTTGEEPPGCSRPTTSGLLLPIPYLASYILETWKRLKS